SRSSPTPRRSTSSPARPASSITTSSGPGSSRRALPARGQPAEKLALRRAIGDLHVGSEHVLGHQLEEHAVLDPEFVELEEAHLGARPAPEVAGAPAPPRAPPPPGGAAPPCRHPRAG